jgi:hypothetical protein
MLGGSLSWMIGKYAGFAEGIELRVGSYQLTYRSSCIRLRKAESDLADDLMTFISPSVRIAALGYESQRKQNIAHRRILPRLRVIIASFCDCAVNCFTMGAAFFLPIGFTGVLGCQEALLRSRSLAGFFHNIGWTNLIAHRVRRLVRQGSGVTSQAACAGI